MMGPCTDQSRKSIHCMGRKRRIFAHFALKILLTARSNGTIKNSIAVLKSNDGGTGCPLGAHDSPPLLFGLLEACACESLLVAQGQGEPLFPSPPTDLPRLHTSIAIGRVVNLHHCTILCFYDNALQIICTGVSSGWMCAFVGRRGFHPCHKTEGTIQGKKHSIF